MPAAGVSKVNVEEAKKLQAEGWTLLALGRRYGVTLERVRQKIGSQRVKVACSHCGTKVLRYTTGIAKTTLCRRCNKAHDHDKCACGRIKKVRSKRCKQCADSRGKA